MAPGVPRRGQVFWVDPNPVAGHELKDKHLFMVLTPVEINKFGVVMMVAISQGANRNMGVTVPISGHKTAGVAVCHQVRSFDFREPSRIFELYDTLDEGTVRAIGERVASLIDP